MLKIAIDGNEANVKNRVGSNVYAFEIISAIEKLGKKRKDVSFTVLLYEKKIYDLPRQRRGWNYQVIKPKKLWTQWALPIYLYKNQKKYDVFFTPGHYAPRICPIPYVSSIMDLAFLDYPKQFRKSDLLQLKNWSKYSVKNAKKIITISKFSKSEIIKKYGKKADDIVVAYPAISDRRSKISYRSNFKQKVFKEFGLSKNYILSVSTLQPRKNLIRLIEAFEKISVKVASNSIKFKRTRGRQSQFSQISDLQLVIAGKIGWLASDIIEKIHSSPFKKNIILTGFISEDEKQVLYESALAAASIGFYEGFGIPALETLKAGSIPVIAKNTSLPEVVGEAGIKVNPFETSSIAKGLAATLSLTAKQRSIFYRVGREQVKKFSWNKSAQIILKTLEYVAS